MEEPKIICSICLETLKDPMTISCNHFFCSCCLKRHEEVNAKDGMFACPLCNQTVTLFRDGVIGDDEVTYRRGISREAPVQCDVCGPKTYAITKCVECEQNYCQMCSAMHLKIKASRNHVLHELGADDHKENVTLYQRDFCPKHADEEMKIVCKTCQNIPLCLFCKISEHDNHKSRMLTEEVEEVKNMLKNNSMLCASRLKQLQIGKNEGEALDDVINKAEQDEIINVNRQEQELLRLLDEHKQTIKNQAQKFREGIIRVYKEVRKENKEFKNTIEEELSGCVTLQKQAGALIGTAKNSEILKIGYDLSKKLLVESKRTIQAKRLNMQHKAFIPAGLSIQKPEYKMGVISDDITSGERGNTLLLQLKLKIFTGPIFFLEVDNSQSQTIREIKQMIQDKHKIPADDMILRLPFIGKELRDNQCLSDYYIHDGSTIEVDRKVAQVQVEDMDKKNPKATETIENEEKKQAF